ncbi:MULTISPECIES: DUF3718 domain-containing protein [Thalassotalea]|uniref:DUF3718 domain-containing protein n=1 Tax=Thalassotalea TaxID=1518149 RepID=UPI000942D5AC|nr:MULTISPECIES: DUF3718 domain-containing protein [Thalassotalea]OKY27965.1 hypothetical protein BI291_07095 [Thalassotalea sp. PP2-459]
MKLITTAITVAALAIAFNSSANSTALTSATLVSANDSVTTTLCMSAAKGSRVALLTSIKQSGYSRQYINNNLHCNDLPVSDFVAKYGKSPEKIQRMLDPKYRQGQVTIKDVTAP